MDTILKLNNQTAGRDKVIRLLQYGSRASWYFCQNGERTRQSIDILKSLEYTFSSFRKLLRLGRCLDLLYSALSAMKYPNLVVRVTLTLSKIASALFLLADHIIWVGRAGICQVNVDKWSQISNKYWLMAIVMNLVRDVYEIYQIMKQEAAGLRLRTSGKFKSHLSHQIQALCCVKNHTDVWVDTVKNSCDLFIPLTSLGYTKLNPGIIGLLGLLSSIAGIYSLIHPLAKLSPA
ncbi:peroxisomal membrane protein 11B [Athalia rosae]|uniref:peroxisomal membrane protein 11B n=1 Tax=Athalia rosae TaxID=37344 RepID=UPI0020337A06|nr:peroxisomal membrane protein 11B [Athalia rosae]